MADVAFMDDNKLTETVIASDVLIVNSSRRTELTKVFFPLTLQVNSVEQTIIGSKTVELLLFYDRYCIRFLH